MQENKHDYKQASIDYQTMINYQNKRLYEFNVIKEFLKKYFYKIQTQTGASFASMFFGIMLILANSFEWPPLVFFLIVAFLIIAGGVALILAVVNVLWFLIKKEKVDEEDDLDEIKFIKKYKKLTLFNLIAIGTGLLIPLYWIWGCFTMIYISIINTNNNNLTTYKTKKLETLNKEKEYDTNKILIDSALSNIRNNQNNSFENQTNSTPNIAPIPVVIPTNNEPTVSKQEFDLLQQQLKDLQSQLNNQNQPQTEKKEVVETKPVFVDENTILKQDFNQETKFNELDLSNKNIEKENEFDKPNFDNDQNTINQTQQTITDYPPKTNEDNNVENKPKTNPLDNLLNDFDLE